MFYVLYTCVCNVRLPILQHYLLLPSVANGQAERTVQTVKQFLPMATLKGLNWFKVLAVAELSINSAPISHTNVSPFRLNYGFDPCVFSDVYNLDSPVNTRSENVRQFIDRMRSEWVAARAI